VEWVNLERTRAPKRTSAFGKRGRNVGAGADRGVPLTAPKTKKSEAIAIRVYMEE